MFLFDAQPLEPSFILESYIKQMVDTIKEYPQVFSSKVGRGSDEMDGASTITNSIDTEEQHGVSPQRTPSSFTKKLSSKLKRTSTKSLMSVQSSIMSVDTLQTSVASVNDAGTTKISVDCEEVSLMRNSSEITINVESIIKNIIFQFRKMFQNIVKFESKYGDSYVSDDMLFLKQSVNQSIVVETYNLLTEYSLRLLQEEMSDINNQMVKLE